MKNYVRELHQLIHSCSASRREHKLKSQTASTEGDFRYKMNNIRVALQRLHSRVAAYNWRTQDHKMYTNSRMHLACGR